MEKKIFYWIELSDYDMGTAEALLESGRYLYVGFMSHQTIEKILKAYFVSIKHEVAPYSHNLSLLANKSGISDLLSEEQKDFIDMLEPLNIETRYPTYKEQLLKSLTKERCTEILEKTRILQQWIKEKL
jgi:HEPN domain-containing protein